MATADADDGRGWSVLVTGGAGFIGLNLVENEQLRQNFGPRARAVVVPELDVATCAAKHRAAYRQIAGLS